MLAQAFATTLSRDFGLGAPLPPSTGSSHPRGIGTPARLTATAEGNAIHLAWSHAFGADGYWVYYRDLTAREHWTRLPLPVGAEEFTTGPAIPGHVYDYRVAGTRSGVLTGPPSPTAAASVR